MQTVSTARAPSHDPEGLRSGAGGLYPGWTTTGAAAVGLALGPTPLLVFAFSTFAPALQREFGWSVTAVSFGATVVLLMTVVGSLVAGALSDRFGGRRLVLASLPCFGAAVAALSLLGPDIRLFYAALALVGLAAVGVWPVSYNRITAPWFDRHLGLSLGLANAGLALGAAVLPALSAQLIGAAGWRQAYLLLGALVVVLPWPLAWWWLRDRPADGRAGPAAAMAGPGLDFAAARRTPAFRLALVGFIVLGAASSSIVVHLMRILADAGLTPQRALAMQSLMGAAMLVGRLGTGWMLDRIAAPRVMVVLCGAGTLALALLAAGAPAGTAPLCALVIGYLIGAEFDVLGFLIPRYFGRRAFGALYGVIFSAFQISAALTITLLGAWRETAGSYGGALLAVAVLLAGGAWCFGRLGPYAYPAMR